MSTYIYGCLLRVKRRERLYGCLENERIKVRASENLATIPINGMISGRMSSIGCWVQKSSRHEVPVQDGAERSDLHEIVFKDCGDG